MNLGDRVTFRPTHQPDLLLTGTLVGGEGNILRVESDPGNGSIARIYEAHASHVRLVDTPAAADAPGAPAALAPAVLEPFDYEKQHADLTEKIHAAE